MKRENNGEYPGVEAWNWQAKERLFGVDKGEEEELMDENQVESEECHLSDEEEEKDEKVDDV
jgi:hypothetical protein